MFAFNSTPNLKVVRFPYSRFVVDAERLWNDPMEEIGQGIVYSDFAGFHRDVPADRKKILLGMWRQHQNRLKRALSSDSILIDCHSFPSDMGDVYICEGFNEDWSYPGDNVVDLFCHLYERQGYKVGVNNPYSNSMSPQCNFQYPSIMIEVNKRAYLHEDSMRLRTDFKSLKISTIMEKVYRKLLE